jgi:hypothetical protein
MMKNILHYFESILETRAIKIIPPATARIDKTRPANSPWPNNPKNVIEIIHTANTVAGPLALRFRIIFLNGFVNIIDLDILILPNY